MVVTDIPVISTRELNPTKPVRERYNSWLNTCGTNENITNLNKMTHHF